MEKAEHPHKLCIQKGEILCCANFGLATFSTPRSYL